MLAAGAYGSPGDPAAQRHRRGCRWARADDHVGVGFRFEGTERLLREAAEYERERPLFMAQVTMRARARRAGTSSSSRRSSAAPRLRGQRRGFAMKPRSRGTVRLTSPDPRAPLAIDHGFLATRATPTCWPTASSALRALIDGR